MDLRARKAKAFPMRSHACTLAVDPKGHALCWEKYTCNCIDVRISQREGWNVAATRHASPPNLNATPQHHRWSAFTGTRLKAESTSAFHKVGDLPVRRLCSRITLQTSSSASCFSFSVAVTCPASKHEMEIAGSIS